MAFCVKYYKEIKVKLTWCIQLPSGMVQNIKFITAKLQNRQVQDKFKMISRWVKTEFVGRGEEEENIYHKSVQESALPKIVFNIEKHISLPSLSHLCYKKGQTSKTRHKATINAAIYMHSQDMHHQHHHNLSLSPTHASTHARAHTHTHKMVSPPCHGTGAFEFQYPLKLSWQYHCYQLGLSHWKDQEHRDHTKRDA